MTPEPIDVAVALPCVRPRNAGALVTVLLLGLAVFGLTRALAGDATVIGERDGKDIVTVRVSKATQSKQALPVFAGISGKTAGAKSLSLLKVIMPPGGSA